MTAEFDNMLRDAENLACGFVHSARHNPGSPALVVAANEVAYEQLLASAIQIAATVQAASSNAYCAVLGVGTTSVFQSILGILIAGRAYVPLNPAFPIERSAYMLATSGVDLLLVDEIGEALLPSLLPQSASNLTVILPYASSEKIAALSGELPKHTFLGVEDLNSEAQLCESHVYSDSPAYLMFTSGSTGKPKGVVVSHGNVRSFVATIVAMYELGPNDRFTQMFDLTFDLSVFDMFVCWEVGASLWVVPPKSRMAPAAFLRKSELTVWFSVPAVGAFMNQLKMLRANNFPVLRYSLFCGEPLPDTVAEAWQRAAPASRLDNLYGPTELTIACAHHRWDPEKSPGLCSNGIVPIGRVYDGLQSAIVDQNLSKVEKGTAGELCVRGPQTTRGYWQADEITAEKFVAMPWMNSDEDNRWYRTGDVVREGADGQMVFVGRVDNQVKILGYRVELGEIEADLRKWGHTDFAIAVPFPTNAVGSASGIVACLAGSDVDDEIVLDGCRKKLPDYMVPQWILRLDKMPLNANGKIDRNALKSLVEGSSENK